MRESSGGDRQRVERGKKREKRKKRRARRKDRIGGCRRVDSVLSSVCTVSSVCEVAVTGVYVRLNRRDRCVWRERERGLFLCFSLFSLLCLLLC